MKPNRALLLVAAVLLSGFTLYNFQMQTGRTRWHVAHRGAAYNTAVPEETNLAHCFKPAGLDSLFGHAYFRTSGLTCSWTVVGSGGANGVDLKIVHEDGGIDCQCTIGACNAAAATEMDCDCATVVELGRTVMPDGGEQSTTTLCVQVDDATDCAGNPAGLTCDIDLYR